MVQYFIFFLGEPATYWIWPACMVLLLFHHTYLHVSLWELTIIAKVASRMASSSSHSLSSVSTIGLTQRWINWHPRVQSMSALLQPDELCFPSFALVSLVMSNFMAEYVTGQIGLLILVAPWCVESPLLPTIVNMSEYISYQCLDCVRDVLKGWVLKGLPLLHLILWLLKTHAVQAWLLFLSLLGSDWCNSGVYTKCLTAMLERMAG